MFTQSQRLSLSEYAALEYLRYFYNLWKGSTREATQWCLPETRRDDISPYERLVELGFAESSHIELDTIRPKGIISRFVFNLSVAVFFPSGIQHRYKITASGLERVSKNVLGW